jgi:hypothetical protein
MMHLPQATWIETFLEGVTDKNTGHPIFREFVWFEYKVSSDVCSASACEYSWSIEGWIQSKRKKRLSQELVQRLLRTHTNLVMRERLDVVHHLIPWDVEWRIKYGIVTSSCGGSRNKHERERDRQRERKREREKERETERPS